MIENEETPDLLEIFKNPLKNKLMMYLFVYGELSLTELRDKLKKSKSTIHRHLQDLIEAGFIEESKEEQVRGSIKAKYYSISQSYIQKGIHYDMDAMEKDTENIFNSTDEEQITSFFKMMKTSIKTMKKPLEIMQNYGETIMKNYNLYNAEEIQVKPLMKMIFLNETQIPKFKEYLKEFWKKIETLFEDGDDPEGYLGLKPYYFSFAFLNLKNLLEFEQL